MTTGAHPFSSMLSGSNLGSATGTPLHPGSSSGAENPNRPLSSHTPNNTQDSQGNAPDESVIKISFKGAIIGAIGIIMTVLPFGVYVVNAIVEITKISKDLESATQDIDELKKEHKELQQEFHSVDKNQAVMKEKLDTKTKKSK